MPQSKPRPIISTTFDSCANFIIAGVILAVASYYTQKPIPLPLFYSIAAISIILAIVYQTIISPRNLWVSPGEMFTGCVVQGEKKEWVNPYERKTGWLFAICLVTLAITCITFIDLIFKMYIITIGGLILKTALSMSVLIILINAGKGRIWGLYFIAAFFTIMALGTTPLVFPDPKDKFITIGVIGFMALINILVIIMYRKKTKKSVQNVDARPKFWKVMFVLYLLSLLSLFPFLQELMPVRVWEIIDLIFSVVSVVGLYGFCWKKKIWSAKFWKYFFSLLLSGALYMNFLYRPLQS